MNEEKNYDILSVSDKTPSYNERFVVLYSKDGKTSLTGWLEEKER